jgi:hypothetical protein
MRRDLSPELRLRYLQTTLAHLGAGGGAATLQLHAAPLVAAGDVLGLPLVSIELARPPGRILNDVLVLDMADPAGGLIMRSGTPVQARLLTASGAWSMDFDVGLDGSDAVIQLPTLDLRAGGRCPLLSTAIG